MKRLAGALLVTAPAFVALAALVGEGRPTGAPRPGAPPRTAALAVTATSTESGTAAPGLCARGLAVSPVARAAEPAPSGECARIRAGLASADPRVRFASLTEAARASGQELDPDLLALVRVEKVEALRRLAVRALAERGSESLADALRSLEEDPDLVVSTTATFGLARAGDAAEEERLLALCDRFRQGEQATVVAAVAARTFIEDPRLRSPAVLARFERLALEPGSNAATREHARDVLRAKQGGTGPR